MTAHRREGLENFLAGIFPKASKDHRGIREKEEGDMTATEVLKHEHNIVLKVLDAGDTRLKPSPTPAR